MQHFKQYPFSFGIAICLFFLLACSHKKDSHTYIAEDPSELKDITTTLIRDYAKNGKLSVIQDSDSAKIELNSELVRFFYTSQNGEPAWSNKENWDPAADSLFYFIQSAQL